MSSIKNVLIVGAGGNIGTPITTALESAGFTITVVSRESSKSTFKHKTIKVPDTYPHEELVKAMQGQDAIVSTISDLTMQKPLIDAAIEAGVRRFMPSEFGCDTQNEAAVQLLPLFQKKCDIVRYLEARTDQIEWTAVVTGPFFDWAFDKKLTGFDLKSGTAMLVDGGRNKFSTSTLTQVGASVAAVLLHPDDTRNTYIYVESFEVTQLEILAAVEKSMGRKLTVEHQDGKELIAKSQEAAKNGEQYKALLGLLQSCFLISGYGGSFHEVVQRTQAKLGLKTQDLQTETDKVVKAILG